MNLFIMVNSTLKRFGFIKSSSGLYDDGQLLHEQRWMFFINSFFMQQFSPSHSPNEGLIKPKHFNVDFSIINKFISFGILFFLFSSYFRIYFHNFFPYIYIYSLKKKRYHLIDLVSLFNGISTFVGYLMSKPPF